jgi:hypothetical protein
VREIHHSIRASLGLAVIVLGMTGQVARADLTLGFTPINTFSGTPPGGNPTTPVITAAFTDITSGPNAGKVQLVITSTLASGENLDPGKALYLNFTPPSQATSLTFSLTANTGFSEAASVMTTTSTSNNMFKADGDGHYQILFTYASSTKAFTGGESQTYLISSSLGPITSANFNITGDGGTGPYLAAIHVQNTPNGGSGSGWVAGSVNGDTITPEPSTMALAALGTMGLLGYGLRRRLMK